MKKCSYCGAHYPDDVVVCTVDQTPLGAKSSESITDMVKAALSVFMRKPSARIIQVFVAGALAYLGFDSTLLGFYGLVHSQGDMAVTGFIVGPMVLLVGVAIVAGSVRALLWAQIILWLCLIQDVISICVFVFRKFGISLHVPHMSLYYSISSLIELSALLLLIAWSRSRRFRTPNNSLEPL
jgi:hypothetical protein